jgi:hypothetical protein
MNYPSCRHQRITSRRLRYVAVGSNQTCLLTVPISRGLYCRESRSHWAGNWNRYEVETNPTVLVLPLDRPRPWLVFWTLNIKCRITGRKQILFQATCRIPCIESGNPVARCKSDPRLVAFETRLLASQSRIMSLTRRTTWTLNSFDRQASVTTGMFTMWQATWIVACLTEEPPPLSIRIRTHKTRPITDFTVQIRSQDDT